MPARSTDSRPGRHSLLLALAVAGSALVLVPAVLAVTIAGNDGVKRAKASVHDVARAVRPAGANGAEGMARRVITLGYSVRHRAIRVIVLGNPHAPHPTLVVGCIHGNETAGIAVARRLAAGRPGAPLWIIPDLNPDGVAAGTRQNAHGVDLNRNFPYRWRALYASGDPQYGGPRPLSEPESRLIDALILRLAPRTAIWFHQPLGVTDRSGGDVSVEQRFAALTGLPVRQLVRYPGSATTWEDHRFPASTAFVVELPAGRPSPRALARYAGAVLLLASDTVSPPYPAPGVSPRTG